MLRTTTVFLAWLLALGLASAQAQTSVQTPSQMPASAAAAPAASGIEQRSERIQHEDALTRVDELRVGGQTRSITVQPKNGAPAYEVTPLSGGDDPSASRNGSTGKSRWRLRACQKVCVRGIA